MSTSNTLTKNDLKKVLEKISIGSGGVIDADDMTQAEIDDFLEDINAQGTPSEYRKLLWTNSNPATAFAAQTISLDLSDYDEVELFIAGSCATHNTSTQSFKLTVGKGGLLNISANIIWWRYVTPTINGIEFGAGYQTPTYGANGTTNNELMVPYKIYGIKYERVAPPQIEIADYIIEQGISDIWTYRKWNSGIAECWGSWSGTVSHYATVGSFYGYNTGAVNFPTNLFITRPVAKYNCIVGTGFAWPGTNMAITNTSMSMYAVATTSGSQSCQFDIQVIGKWK